MSLYASIFAGIPDALLLVDAQDVVILANPAAGQLLGYAHEELPGLKRSGILPDYADPTTSPSAPHFPSSAASGFFTRWAHHKDGRRMRVDVKHAPLDTHGGIALYILRDATLREAIEARLYMANAVFENTQEAIVVTDIDCRILAVNPAFETVTEYAAAEAIGQNIRLLHSGRHDEYFYRQMWHSIHAGGEWQGAIWNRRKNGEIYQEWLTISTIRDRHGRPFQYVGISADMSRMNHVETQFEKLAHYDPLTGLPNRLLFNSRLQKTWERAHRDRKAFAVMYLDLDGFKQVNDTHGHIIGDELLKAVAARLYQNIRETDTLARLGGDEFVIVLEDPTREDVIRIAQAMVEHIAAPFDLASARSVRVGLSLGWSYYPEHADNIDTLLQQADQALYQVKRGGRGAARMYTPH